MNWPGCLTNKSNIQHIWLTASLTCRSNVLVSQRYQKCQSKFHWSKCLPVQNTSVKIHPTEDPSICQDGAIPPPSLIMNWQGCLMNKHIWPTASLTWLSNVLVGQRCIHPTEDPSICQDGARPPRISLIMNWPVCLTNKSNFEHIWPTACLTCQSRMPKMY
jgi:hypothetical protein